MRIETDKMVTLVLRLLDEDSSFLRDRVQYADPESPLENLIVTLLPMIAEEVILAAEPKEIDEYEDFDAEVEWIEPGHGAVELPPDFLRFRCFRMSDWSRKVTEPLSAEGENYMLYARNYSGRFRGRKRSPAVVITAAEKGARLEFFGSLDPGAYPVETGYIPMPQEDEPGMIRIPRALILRVAEAIAERIKKIRS